LHSEKGLPTGASLFSLLCREFTAGGVCPVAEILAFDGSMEKGTAKFPLFFRCFLLFLRKNTLGTAGAMSAGNAIFIMVCEIHILLT
jgi:hypothetical protein